MITFLKKYYVLHYCRLAAFPPFPKPLHCSSKSCIPWLTHINKFTNTNQSQKDINNLNVLWTCSLNNVTFWHSELNSTACQAEVQGKVHFNFTQLLLLYVVRKQVHLLQSSILWKLQHKDSHSSTSNYIPFVGEWPGSAVHWRNKSFVKHSFIRVDGRVCGGKSDRSGMAIMIVCSLLSLR